MLMAVAGTLDKSFSGDGKATVAVANFRLVAQDVAVQADGKTVIVGPATRNVSPPNPFFAVARLNLDGTPDTTFGDGGFASPSGVAFSTFRGSREHFTRAVAIQPDGKIVVAGELGGEWAVARYLSNGTLDLSFDGDGVQTIGFNSVVRDIAVQSNGKIVVVGTHLDGIVLINFNIAIARLNPNGSFDRSFDGDGDRRRREDYPGWRIRSADGAYPTERDRRFGRYDLRATGARLDRVPRTRRIHRGCGVDPVLGKDRGCRQD
jgi:uncharacterized delta-60 repeat protein